MKRLTICLWFLFAYSTGFAEDIVIFDVKNPNDSTLKSNTPRDENGAIIATSNPIVFEGNFNLDANRKLALDLENPENVILRFDVEFLDDLKTKNQEINRRISAVVGPNEKGRIVIDALKPLKHPEILKKMKIMRNDPFARCARNASCNMSNVKRITIKAVIGHSSVPPVRISKIIALDTSSEKLPDWYYMGEKEFFPFIDKYGQFKFKMR